MVMTDPIADLFTRVRNGLSSRLDTIDIPFSNSKLSILKILVSEGFLNGCEVFNFDGVKKFVKVSLKYRQNGDPVISCIERRSRPGNRFYIKKRNIPKILNGFGISIISTSSGILTGKDARINNQGGEFLGVVY